MKPNNSIKILAVVVVVLTTLAGQIYATDKQSVTANAVSPNSGEQIKWQVVSGGGTRATSTNYIGTGTLGQVAIGPVSSTNYKTNQGFWQSFSGCCIGQTGNADCDPANGTDISDLSRMIDYLYISFAPLCCQQAANTDGSGDGNVDISDLSRLIDYLYISFTPTAACQ